MFQNADFSSFCPPETAANSSFLRCRTPINKENSPADEDQRKKALEGKSLIFLLKKQRGQNHTKHWNQKAKYRYAAHRVILGQRTPYRIGYCGEAAQVEQDQSRRQVKPWKSAADEQPADSQCGAAYEKLVSTEDRGILPGRIGFNHGRS